VKPALIPKTVPAAEPEQDDAETYELGPSTLSVEAEFQAMGEQTLRFHAKGQLIVSPTQPLATSVKIDVDTKSADGSMGIVTDMAKSDDFLAVETYPTAGLTSRSIAKDATGATVLYGEITLHGSTRVVEVPVSVVIEGCKVDVASEFGINRHDYHIDSDRPIDGIVSDTFVVRFHAHPVRNATACHGP
jgi:polyisoprenoid-binding protein YceI